MNSSLKEHHVNICNQYTAARACSARNLQTFLGRLCFNLIIDRFLSAPLPLSQSDDGLAVNLESQNFASLFTTIALGKKVLPSQAFKQFPRSIPYDCACSTLQSELSKRVCSQCGLYCASITSSNAHRKCCDVSQESHPRRLRPLRVAAQRQRELMCILSYVDGIEEQEWLDQQDVIIDQFHPVPTTTLETATPIISTSREPLWRIVK